LIYLVAAVVTSFVGATVRRGLLFIRGGTLSIAHRRHRTFGRCFKPMNASSFEVRLLLLLLLTRLSMWFGVRITEQELELHLSDSTIRKLAFAVEPRQLTLNVRITLRCL
jgi:hypothetical protein